MWCLYILLQIWKWLCWCEICRYYVVYHKFKVPGEKFLLLTSRTRSCIFYVELSSLWTVNKPIFCWFWFLYISYRQHVTQYFISGYLHQLRTANNAVFCLFCFLCSPLWRFKNYFTLCLPIFSNTMGKFFLHINFPMVLIDQKWLYLIKNEIFKITTQLKKDLF